jgi:hypothetical protein
MVTARYQVIFMAALIEVAGAGSGTGCGEGFAWFFED